MIGIFVENAIIFKLNMQILIHFTGYTLTSLFVLIELQI